PPSGYGLASRELGTTQFVFACAPDHPLAKTRQPLSAEKIAEYRAVVVADSSRTLPARSAGLQPRQNLLVVPTLAAKLDAQAAGLGVGFMPRHYAELAVKARRLVIREVQQPREAVPLRVAWRADDEGKALHWFRETVLGNSSLKKLLT